MINQHHSKLHQVNLLSIVFSCTIVFFLCINPLNAQSDKPFFPPYTVGGIDVTATSTGSVVTYSSDYTSCEISTPANAPWMGSGGAFTYTLTFSKPIKKLVVVITATGNPANEIFTFTSNGGDPTIKTTNSCYTTIDKNEIKSGLNSPGPGGGGVFVMTTPAAFTTFTISGPGGENGSIFAFQMDAKQTCTVPDFAPLFTENKLIAPCPDNKVDLKKLKAYNLPHGLELTWHTSTPAKASNRLSDEQVGGGTYYAAFYDKENKCFGPGYPVEVTLPDLPKVFAGEDMRVPFGDSVTLTASGAVKYTWDHGVVQGKAFVPLENRTYTVTGTDASGCSATDQLNVIMTKARVLKLEEIPLRDFDSSSFKPINVVFVLDISNSMASDHKIDLLKTSMINLLEIIRPEDKITLVTYATDATVIMGTKSGVDKSEIIEKIEQLRPRGYTAGTKGMKLAYKLAQKAEIEGGSNMLIVITDGAFDDTENYLKLVEKYAKQQIYLSVVGIKNTADEEANMREAALKGNGRYVPIFKPIDAKQNLILEIKKHAFKHY